MVGFMLTAPVAARPPVHRDPNVLRWLGAYTASMVGDSVYFMALAWEAARSGSPAQAASSSRSAPYRVPC